MRVVLAPDKFKGCLRAGEVAAAVGKGLLRIKPDLDVVTLPIADGGDGTVEAAVSAGYRRVTVPSVGPTGKSVTASYGVQGSRAVVELADVVGLDRLPAGTPDALVASTYGLGLVIRDAVANGAKEIVLGVGGSASTDGGAGLVQALGGRITGAAGGELARGGGQLITASAIDLRDLRDLLEGVSIIVASDVENPLLGTKGAAAVFGPQKGASESQLVELEAGLAHWARLVADVTGRDESSRPGAGAAGGTGFAALALLGAQIRPGIDLVLELVGFVDALEGADLVITGEGSLDEQSLSGKAPIGVSRAVVSTGVPVVAVAGRCLLNAERLAGAGISAAYPLSDLEPDSARSMANAGPLLTRVGERIATDWLS